jgi:hypothetical protein
VGTGQWAPSSVEIGKLKPLLEQVVVIMGASSGVGRQPAPQMGRRGARLVVAARDGEALHSLVDQVTGSPSQRSRRAWRSRTTPRTRRRSTPPTGCWRRSASRTSCRRREHALFDKARSHLGVKPMPMPPIDQPATVAPLILHAAEHPTRELLARGSAEALVPRTDWSGSEPIVVDTCTMRR